jgi:hypothetical protein
VLPVDVVLGAWRTWGSEGKGRERQNSSRLRRNVSFNRIPLFISGNQMESSNAPRFVDPVPQHPLMLRGSRREDPTVRSRETQLNDLSERKPYKRRADLGLERGERAICGGRSHVRAVNCMVT